MKQNDTLYWWAQNGAKRGPLSLEKLRELVRNGTIPRSSAIWSEGWEDWRSIESIAQSLAIPAMNRKFEPLVIETGKKASHVSGVLWAGSAFVAVVCLLLPYIPKDWNDKANAELAIHPLLKAPSTAKFSNVVVIKGKDGNIVTGDVDSQNSYGAMIRTAWVVAMKDGKVVSAKLIE